jgi:hypothetical protein
MRYWREALCSLFIVIIVTACHRREQPQLPPEDSDNPRQSCIVSDASLVINSNPSSAQVRVSGDDAGLTPAKIDTLTERHQKVELRLAGYFPAFGDVTLMSGQTTVFDSTLTPAPDMSICYMRRDSLFSLSLDGMTRKVWATDACCHKLAWSPNGLYLAYATQSGVTILNRDGRIRSTLKFPTTARADDFTWSNGGTKLAVGSYVDGIYVYNAVTNKTKRVLKTVGFTYDHCPTFSPDDSMIAYVHHEWGSEAWICIMRADGTGARQMSEQLSTRYDADLYLTWVRPDAILWAQNGGLFSFSPTTGRSDTLIKSSYCSSLVVSPDRTRYVFCGDKSLLCTVGDPATREIENISSDITWESDGESFSAHGFNTVQWVTWADGAVHQIVLRP